MSAKETVSIPDDEKLEDIDPYNPGYVNSKWRMEKPRKWRSFLTSFMLFPKLPLELQRAVWKFTLMPRIVEMQYREKRGFYPLVKAPRALCVSVDSRKAVKHLYPVCFGNIFHSPQTVFNFSLDTLYFDNSFGSNVYSFLLSLQKHELNSIRYLAVDHLIDDFHEWGDYGEEARVNMEILKPAVAPMSSLEEFHFVCKLDWEWHGHGFPEGQGAISLSEAFPYKVQNFMFQSKLHLDDEDGEFECQDPPNLEHALEGFEVKKKGTLWGWRPTNMKAALRNWVPNEPDWSGTDG